jgi:hypothetical protein
VKENLAASSCIAGHRGETSDMHEELKVGPRAPAHLVPLKIVQNILSKCSSKINRKYINREYIKEKSKINVWRLGAKSKFAEK